MVPCSGVVLAGGASRRIGTSKANPLLAGRSLLAWQAEKLRILGIQDIMLSGKDCPELPGTRVIPDKLPGWSPLGGLYSCFHAAENARCMVLNAVARRYGSPWAVHIELARKMSRNFADRQKVNKQYQENRAANERLIKQIEEIKGSRATGQELVKFKLFRDQLVLQNGKFCRMISAVGHMTESFARCLTQDRVPLELPVLIPLESCRYE